MMPADAIKMRNQSETTDNDNIIDLAPTNC